MSKQGFYIVAFGGTFTKILLKYMAIIFKHSGNFTILSKGFLNFGKITLIVFLTGCTGKPF